MPEKEIQKRPKKCLLPGSCTFRCAAKQRVISKVLKKQSYIWIGTERLVFEAARKTNAMSAERTFHNSPYQGRWAPEVMRLSARLACPNRRKPLVGDSCRGSSHEPEDRKPMETLVVKTVYLGATFRKESQGRLTGNKASRCRLPRRASGPHLLGLMERELIIPEDVERREWTTQRVTDRPKDGRAGYGRGGANGGRESPSLRKSRSAPLSDRGATRFSGLELAS